MKFSKINIFVSEVLWLPRFVQWSDFGVDTCAETGKGYVAWIPDYNQHNDQVLKDFLICLKSAHKDGVGLIIAECHDVIINTIGHLINLKILQHEDVKVFLMGNDRKVSEHTYNSDGVLVDPWPFGWDLLDICTIENFKL